MKTLIKIFGFLLLCHGVSLAQISYDITATGMFSPSAIENTQMSTLDLEISNSTPTGEAVAAGDMIVTVIIGSGAETTAADIPTGPNAAAFDWTFLAATTNGGWYGVSNTPLAAFFENFMVGIPVTATAISSNGSTYDVSPLPPELGGDNSDSNGANDTGTATLTVSALLPVEFTRFGVDAADCETASLSWATEQEVNNQGFHVERSVEANGRFETVGFVKARSNQNGAGEYKFEDNYGKGLKGASNVYYRLKQVDLDGAFEYSDIVRGKVDCNAIYEIRGYPNPVMSDYNLEINGLPGTNNVLLMNDRNQLIRKFTATRNTNNIVNMKELQAGVYQLIILDDENKTLDAKKVIKIAN